MIATMAITALSWHWVTELFSDQRVLIQVGAVVLVVAIFLLSMGKNK